VPAAGAIKATMPADEGGNPCSWLLLALLTIAAAWLRLAHLGSKSLWLDEGATVTLARTSWSHFAWVWWHGEANLQTVYFLLMRAWVLGGQSETWLRLPSALFGIASVPMLYIVGRKLAPAGAALAAAALLAFSPAHVYYSQEARSYSLTIFLVLLSSYYFVRSVEHGQPRDWLRWTVVGILAFYSHDFAALVLVAQASSLLFRKISPVTWKRVILCGMVMLVAALPGLTYVFRASPENLHFIWMPRATPKKLWHLVNFFGGSGVKSYLALALWVAGLVAITRTRRRDPDAFWHGMLIVSWGLLPAFITALVSLRHPIFMQRYLIFSLPAMLLLAGAGGFVLRRMHIGAILVVALCTMSAIAVVKGYHKPREDWRSASHAILAAAQPGDAVVFFPFYTRTMLDYYRDRDEQASPRLHVFAPQFYGGGEDERNLLQALDTDPQQFPHVWVVLYGADSVSRNSAPMSAVLAAKLQRMFGPPETRQFTDIEVLKYGK